MLKVGAKAIERDGVEEQQPARRRRLPRRHHQFTVNQPERADH
jgi:hypothetical protein